MLAFNRIYWPVQTSIVTSLPIGPGTQLKHLYLRHLIQSTVHSDTGSSTLLVSLDLSAAFDTIDHRILISRLRTSFGVTGSVLSWLQSYLANHTQSVRIGLHSSAPTVCTSGVPQGSVLGPLLFSTYTSPIAMITRSFHVCHQQYADDTQLFIALNPSDPSII